MPCVCEPASNPCATRYLRERAFMSSQRCSTCLLRGTSNATGNGSAALTPVAEGLSGRREQLAKGFQRRQNVRAVQVQMSDETRALGDRGKNAAVREMHAQCIDPLIRNGNIQNIRLWQLDAKTHARETLGEQLRIGMILGESL